VPKVRTRTPKVSQVYVVVDMKGAGRIVGVFGDSRRAEEVQSVNPSYYKVVPTIPNEVNKDCFRWLQNEHEREALRAVAEKEPSA
jgi:hypothetical protein